MRGSVPGLKIDSQLKNNNNFAAHCLAFSGGISDLERFNGWGSWTGTRGRSPVRTALRWGTSFPIPFGAEVSRPLRFAAQRDCRMATRHRSDGRREPGNLNRQLERGRRGHGQEDCRGGLRGFGSAASSPGSPGCFPPASWANARRRSGSTGGIDHRIMARKLPSLIRRPAEDPENAGRTPVKSTNGHWVRTEEGRSVHAIPASWQGNVAEGDRGEWAGVR